MRAEIYWIPEARVGRLAVMPRPRAGDWLADESILCQNKHIEFISFPIADRQVPASPSAAIELVHRISILLQQGKNVAIHCRAGIGRSGLLAACVLVSQGFDVADAFEGISNARGTAVPDTEEQRIWIADVAKYLRKP